MPQLSGRPHDRQARDSESNGERSPDPLYGQGLTSRHSSLAPRNRRVTADGYPIYPVYPLYPYRAEQSRRGIHLGYTVRVHTSYVANGRAYERAA